jgi:protein-S-isoprenylcysteine O-methyltransferase Ste14
MASHPSATRPVSASGGSKLLQAVTVTLIRRRILISGVLFGLLVAYTFVYGPKPHNLVDIGDPLSVAGGLMVVAGLALRSWAAGILRKNAELTTVGPYRLIRNPLYAGSFLMTFGFCTLLGYPVGFLFILVPLVAIYVVQVRQEELLLAQRFADQWPDYARTTPRFVPRLARVDLAAPWRFSQWLKHREYQAILASLAALAAIQMWHLL